MLTTLVRSALPPDAVEVGRVLDAWGVKGWVKILAHSSDPEALLKAKSWFLQMPDEKFRPGFNLFSGTITIPVQEAKIHSDTVVASFAGIDDRTAAQALRGCRIFLPRSAFPAASTDEYYWVDLIGLDVVNREGVNLGRVRDLMTTGPQSVLCVEYAPVPEPGLEPVTAAKPPAAVTAERLIPFVAVFVDKVDIAARCITVDWQPDY